MARGRVNPSRYFKKRKVQKVELNDETNLQPKKPLLADKPEGCAALRM